MANSKADIVPLTKYKGIHLVSFCELSGQRVINNKISKKIYISPRSRDRQIVPDRLILADTDTD